MVFTFAYDYRHRLVKHTGHWQPWGGWGASQSGTSWRLYDGDRIVLRSDSVGGYSQNAEYIWGRDLTGRHASGDGTGGLLMVRSNGINYLPRQDGQGNIWRFSGGYSQSLKAFGQVTFYAQNVPVTVPIGLLAYAHGSKEYFGELGLYNYGRRFYDPKHGRFVGRDPIAEEGGMNLYRFVGNNPVNRWDYLGMIEVSYKGSPFIDSSKLLDGVEDLEDGSDEDESLVGKFQTKWEIENATKYAGNVTGEFADQTVVMDPFLTTVSRGNSSRAGGIMTGTLAIAGIMLADDVTLIGIADDPAIPFILLGGAAIAGSVWVYDHVKKSTPSTQSKPTNAPPGTVPLPQAGLPQGIHGEIKKAVDAGPKDWTGIAPNGDVITTGPDGKAINHGPWGNYVGGRGGGG